MTVFDNFKNKNIDELVDWLDEYGAFDNSPWTKYFDNNYCSECESEYAYIEEFNSERECSYCELNNKCRFFQDLDDTPDNKQIIKMWLESEINDDLECI